MKKLFVEFILVFFLFLGIRMIVQSYQNGKEIVYQVQAEKRIYQVKENYTKNQKNNTDGYYFEISNKNDIFAFQTYQSFDGKQNIITKIHEYQDDQLKCILPVFKENKIITDILCIEDKEQVYYHSLKGKNQKLDQFVSSLNQDYIDKNFTDSKTSGTRNGTVTFYSKQVMNSHGIMMSNYRGVMELQENKIREYTLFSNDVYDQKLNAVVGQYYFVADYEQPFEIDRFYLVDLQSNEKEIIETKYMISKDSYIQGIVDDCIYIYDRTNQKQYEVDIHEKKIYQIGNADIKIKYYDGNRWSTTEMYDIATRDIYFEPYKVVTKQFSGYDKVIQIGGDLTGYYYLYKKDENGYRVYRTPIKNKNSITYLFRTLSIEDITYLDGYVFFLEHNDLKCFHEMFGIKTIATNTEFEFNSTLQYGIFKN